MKKSEKTLLLTTSILGIISVVCFVVGYLFFETLRPKMISFEKLPANTDYLMNYVGIGLMLITIFHLFSFFRTLSFLKNIKKIPLLHIVFLIGSIISFLFIFGDVALLNDIGKQYKHGLSQPEWNVLYVLMVFQFIFASIMTYWNMYKLREKDGVKYIAKDINIFIVAQYIGIVSGLIGLFIMMINFLFPRPLWMIKIHALITSCFLVIPYAIIIAYWFFVKMKEKEKILYDEKQAQDIGRSSILTLISSLVFMGVLFYANFQNLSETLSVLWFPIFAFFVLFTFSSSILYFSQYCGKESL